MTKKHANISLFVPNLGCPNMCSFCNQRHIAGSDPLPDKSAVDVAVKTALESGKIDPEITQIAFFGGSFTAIDKDYMLSLLEAAYTYVSNGTVSGVRISTRPDAIDEDVLNTLKKYGVTSIELGAQSMDDTVLFKNDRGHTAEDVFAASYLIKKHGFELGLQMMTGLYGDTDEKCINTAEKIIEIHPDTVRIYPTVTLKNTKLEKLYLNGEYIPPTLDETVFLVSKLLDMFEENGISVIRTGLHTIDQNAYVAGAWHPAFKELCDSERFLKKITANLKNRGEYTVFVSPKDLSKAIGQEKKNVIKLKNMGYDCKFLPDRSLDLGAIKIKGDEIVAVKFNTNTGI